MRHAPSGEIKLANILVTTNSGEVQSGLPHFQWTLRTGEFDLDHAEIQTHRTIQDQAASSTDRRDLQHRVNVQAARCVTAPRSGENCMYARLFSRSL